MDPAATSNCVEPLMVYNNGIPIGRALLEIFYVRFDERDSGDIYGDIKVVDGDGTEFLWTRTQENPLRIHSGENILLEGPSRLLVAADELNIIS
ncbi:hypothetical protein BDV98DRAFT_578411 [Pterulicium gracile]|uniref:DUF6598 domain-containing protein n=1 Tax=Pterulicium gracile TaxID=1884261 RepID=A0A5C3Q1Y6_9AGAR|nr:hypothetical protein BDV98DRAFT_578411 [Pterula gracilis]